jgi:general secretion pathway protein D
MIRSRPPLPILGVALAGSLLLPGVLPHAQAQRRGLSSTAEAEIVRRQNAVYSADESIRRGDAAMIREDYSDAMKEYRNAVDSLNEGPATATTRPKALRKFFDATMKLAEQRIVEGRYLEAEATAKVILQPQYDPGYKPALTMLQHLEDPEYYNQTITPKFIDKVQQVKQLFLEAQGFFDSARYELAYKRYEQILSLDPTNIAARKGEERINAQRIKYADAAYDHTRSQAVWEVAKGWERPVRRFGLEADPRKGMTKVRDDQGTVAINRKLSQIIIPNIEFRQTTIRDAVEFLRQEARRLDTDENPDNRGVNIFLKLPSPGTAVRTAAAVTGVPGDATIPGLDVPTAAPSIPSGPAPSADTRITLTLSRIPLLEALRYVASQAGLKVKVEAYAVSIVPLAELTDALITAEFRVPPTFIGTTSTGGVSGSLNQGPTSAGAGGGGARDVTGVGSASINRQEAKAFLESNGVTFPPGASATYLPSSSKLVVRNTQENIDLIETLVQQTETVIRQVEIESKFVEITNTNVKELSFDVNVGQSNFPGPNEKVFIGGGTAGASSATSQTSGAIFTNPSGGPIGGNPLTGGLRSGTFAIQANAVDALLFGGAASAAAPGIFSVAGVFTDPQFQVIVRALNQSRGVDLLSAPRVTTKSGQKATIEIIREFLYPTQFQPPQIPQNFGNQNGGGGNVSINPLTGLVGGGGGSNSFPVTPTTPTSFEKRNTGVTLEVEPVIGPDNFTIDLNLQPQVVEFEGFINYGSPIQTISSNPLQMAPVVLTPNVINQPIFNTRKVSTSVSVYDGSTVVLGGLVREDVQRVNDKVPVLGDVPLVGRLFRSKVDQNIKRNLIIFVTARLIDPAGQPLTSTEEEEEIVQPLVGPDNLIVAPQPGFMKK